MRLNALHPEDNPMEALLFCFGGDDDGGDSGGGDAMDAELDAISDQFDAMDRAYDAGETFGTSGDYGYASSGGDRGGFSDADITVTYSNDVPDSRDNRGDGDGGFGGGRDTGPSESDIAQIYRDELGREPDEEGLSYWKNDSGLTTEQIRETISKSDEAKDVVTQIYKDELDREPDDEGLEYWTSDDLTVDEIRQTIRDSEEAKSIRDTDTDIDTDTSATIGGSGQTVDIDDTDTSVTVGGDDSVTIDTGADDSGLSDLTDEQLDDAIDAVGDASTAVSQDVKEQLEREKDRRAETDTTRDTSGSSTSGSSTSRLSTSRPSTSRPSTSRPTTTPPADIEVEVPEPEPELDTQFTYSEALDYALSQGLDPIDAEERAQQMIGTRPYSFAPEKAVSIQETTGLGLDINQLPGADRVQFDATGKMVSAPKEFQDAYEELTNTNPLTGETVITIGGSLQRDDALSQEIESLLQEGYELGFEDDELVSPEGVTVNIADILAMAGASGGPEGGSAGGGGQEGERGGGGARGGLSFDPGGIEGADVAGEQLPDVRLPEFVTQSDQGSIVPDGGAGEEGAGTDGASEEARDDGAATGLLGGDESGGISILPGEEGPIIPGGEGSGVVGAGGDDVVGAGDEGTGGGIGGGTGTGSGTGVGTGSGDGTGTGVGDGSGTGTGPGGTGSTGGTGPGSGTDGDGTGGDDDDDDDDDFEIVEEELIDPYEFGTDEFDPLLDFEYRQPQITSPFDFARDFGSYTLSPEIEQSFQELTERRRAAGFEPAALYEPEFLEQIGIMTPERQAEPGIAALIGSRFPQFTPAGQGYPFTSTPEESAEALVNELLGRT